MPIHASNRAEVRTALGDGATLTETQECLLDILLDPDAHTSTDAFAECPYRRPLGWILGGYRPFGTMAPSLMTEAQQVADTLLQHYENQFDEHAGPPFTFTWGSDADTEITGYEIALFLGRQDNPCGSYLLEYHPLSELVDDTTGLRHALFLAQRIDEAYQRLLAQAVKCGLLPDISTPSANSGPEGPELALAEAVDPAIRQAACVCGDTSNFGSSRCSSDRLTPVPAV